MEQVSTAPTPAISLRGGDVVRDSCLLDECCQDHRRGAVTVNHCWYTSFPDQYPGPVSGPPPRDQYPVTSTYLGPIPASLPEPVSGPVSLSGVVVRCQVSGVRCQVSGVGVGVGCLDQYPRTSHQWPPPMLTGPTIA